MQHEGTDAGIRAQATLLEATNALPEAPPLLSGPPFSSKKKTWLSECNWDLLQELSAMGDRLLEVSIKRQLTVFPKSNPVLPVVDRYGAWNCTSGETCRENYRFPF